MNRTSTMGHLLLAAALAAFTTPAIADTGGAFLSRPLAGSVAGHPSGTGRADASVALATDGARAVTGRVQFVGGVVMPTGGAHTLQPVVSRKEVVQTIRKTDYRVLEIVYR